MNRPFTNYLGLRWLLPALALSFLFVPVTSAPGNNNNKNCHRVNHGQSIQKAIDKARPGDCIEVWSGTYHEQLEITTDRISLIGHNAVLVPPSHPQHNFCTGLSQNPDKKETQAGICIHGRDIRLEPFVAEHRRVSSVGRPISRVRVEGFEVRGFDGENIAVVGGCDVQVSHNYLVDGGLYGILTVGSTGTDASDNNITASNIGGLTIAMCMDDKSNAKFARNDIDGYLIALCGQTSGGVMSENRVRNCCLGPVVDPGKRGVQVYGNHILARNPVCDYFPDSPGAGVVLLGAIKAVVKGNTIEGMKAANHKAVGMFLTDSGGFVADGNVVKENKLKDNDFDIFNNSTGKANALQGNFCATSAPGNYCV